MEINDSKNISEKQLLIIKDHIKLVNESVNNVGYYSHACGELKSIC